MSIHDLISLITVLVNSWPLAALILGFVFRRRINDLIELKISDKFYAKFRVVPFGQDQFDLINPVNGQALPRPTIKQLGVPSGVKWENVADLFWLGADLIWTGQLALRGAPQKRILRGLTQSYHHISELGLAEHAAGKQLASMKSATENRSEADLSREWRSNFSGQIWDVTRILDKLVRGQQPGYRPEP